MLIHLQIRDLALIDFLDLELGTGLHALTGETGAGKSIVIDALGLALGQRASRDMIRRGADAASVQAAFAVSPGADVLAVLRELDPNLTFDPEDDVLLLRRDISRQGPSRCWVNGRLVTVAQLQEVGRWLVEIHGQHDQQTLLTAREQLRVLDQFGSEDIAPLRAAYNELYEQWQTLRREVEKLVLDDGERARRLDLLRYQTKEIEGAALQSGEDDALREERRLLVHADQLAEAIQHVYALLHGGDGQGSADRQGSAADALAAAVSLLERVVDTDARLEPLRESVAEALIRVEESRPALRRYLETVDADPGRLEAVEDRLAELEELKRKYGPSLDDVLAFWEQAAAELEALESYDDRREERTRALEEAAARLDVAAEELSAARRRWATELQQRIQAELQDLRLGEPRLEIRVTALAENGPAGKDQVEWFFSANRGEELKPLARVASGGELSRVMLAVKAVLAAVDEAPTVIFDEVDAGIGGETAVAVGRRLVELARHRQVLCVTHLPQIAALADRQLAVDKRVEGDRTRVQVVAVEGEERVTELARMLGDAREASSLDHARRLLERHGEEAAG